MTYGWKLKKTFMSWGHNIINTVPFNEKIETLSPGDEITYDLVNEIELFNKYNGKRMPTRFSIKAKYTYDQKTIEEITKINILQNFNLLAYCAPTAKDLKGIEEAIVSLKDAVEKLKVR